MTRRLTLSWGVAPVLTDIGDDVRLAASRIRDELFSHRAIDPGSVIVFVSVSTDLADGAVELRETAASVGLRCAAGYGAYGSVSFHVRSTCFFISSRATVNPVAMRS